VVRCEHGPRPTCASTNSAPSNRAHRRFVRREQPYREGIPRPPRRRPPVRPNCRSDRIRGTSLTHPSTRQPHEHQKENPVPTKGTATGGHASGSRRSLRPRACDARTRLPPQASNPRHSLQVKTGALQALSTTRAPAWPAGADLQSDVKTRAQDVTPVERGAPRPAREALEAHRKDRPLIQPGRRPPVRIRSAPCVRAGTDQAGVGSTRRRRGPASRAPGSRA
jgi:hypothetical protein